MSRESIDERRALAESGVVLATLVIEAGRGGLIAGPHLEGRGLTEAERAALPEIAQDARQALTALSAQRRSDEAFMRDELASAVQQAFKMRTHRRPAVVPQVVKV